ncbi:zinc-alpha-2-glycoprotein-like isoform X2 [Puntigrus tetrazona]|uniref:zinc-alpha-2-glycoprotein-like isoform X2 n=1 Tax=Puntigrus tetrazona TaxID=1606681 RepID=UPI001C8AA361|nr:zinc-alpha-2-glycoprotein-like isoform X2 [Puntigrus tetrazona]
MKYERRMLMFFVAVQATCMICVHCERHYLQYRYTVLTRPDGFSGPVFSAVCLCDDRQISHYSNEEQIWKRDRLDADIWRDVEEPDVSREWLLHLVNTLANCTSSRCDGLHTLQRTVGCEVDKRPDGSVMSVNAFDEYGFDGDDFIAFDMDAMQWKDKSPKARETKTEWDADRLHNQHLQSYLNNIIDWISTFKALTSTPPSLHMFASESPHERSELSLTCLATDFYPKHTEMKITLNNTTLRPFSSTGVRPNGHQTFQMRTSVKIHRDDKQSYECRVLHSGQTLTASWEGSLESRCHYSAIFVFFAFAFCVCRAMHQVFNLQKEKQRTR